MRHPIFFSLFILATLTVLPWAATQVFQMFGGV